MEKYKKYISYIKKNFSYQKKDDKIEVMVNNICIYIYYNLKWEVKNFKNAYRQNCFDLNKEENWSVLILFLKLLNKGYKIDEIYLEKSFKLGHENGGYLDIAVYNKEKPFAFIEVKKNDEYEKYKNVFKYENKSKQLFSYIQQDKNVEIASYYSFNPDLEKDFFSTVIIDENLRKSNSIDDLFEKWNKVWEECGILDWEKFRFSFSPIKYSDLRELTRETIKLIFNQFLTILRQHSVSDKSNAFDKLINIFLVKVIDERIKESNYMINEFRIEGALKFQFIENVDTSFSFLKRLNDLYKDGMKEFMDKDIIDYKDSEIEQLINSSNSNNKKIMKIFDDLRLKKNNAFAFIEVFDDKTFEQNSLILKEIVCLFQKYKFKYSSKFQYLGDFFEELLNTSWKQESGQFFTPMPIVDFMIKSLPIKEQIEKNIQNNLIDFLPKMIDNACGSGHFLISFMDEIQTFINDYSNPVNSDIKKKIDGWKINSYSWAKDSIIGIEKDYRLAKTTKISGFLNGDGEATIINGDGINKFSSEEYRNTILYSQKSKIEKFDFFITNPPFSVDGFLKNILVNDINENDFSLLKFLPKTSHRIEILFVERMYQLLKVNGFAAIILPQSIFTIRDYVNMREFIFNNFEILSICSFGDITFSGTTTSPTILFLRKREENEIPNFEEKVLIINSPKMIKKSSKEEKEFLGYEFSSNRNKLGIQYINENLKRNYSTIIKNWIINKDIFDIVNKNELIKVRKLKDIIIDIDIEKMIYPNKEQRPDKNWKTLFELGFVINEKINIDSAINNISYVEIGDIENSKINIKSNKVKKSKNICFNGDILFSSLTPSKEKIAISDNTYYLSDAIFVIRHKNEKFISWLFNYFMKDEKIFKDINSILDGFKVTYSKITVNNLLNNIYFDTKDIHEKIN